MKHKDRERKVQSWLASADFDESVNDLKINKEASPTQAVENVDRTIRAEHKRARTRTWVYAVNVALALIVLSGAFLLLRHSGSVPITPTATTTTVPTPTQTSGHTDPTTRTATPTPTPKPSVTPIPTPVVPSYVIERPENPEVRKLISWTEDEEITFQETIIDMPDLGDVNSGGYGYVSETGDFVLTSFFDPSGGTAQNGGNTETQLGIYTELENGVYRYTQFAQAAPDRTATVDAVSERYIIWYEYTTIPVGHNADLHVYDRESKEDTLVLLPHMVGASEDDRNFTPYGGLLVGDSYSFAYTERDSVEKFTVYHRDLYQYDISSGELKKVATDIQNPFLYNGELAWFQKLEGASKEYWIPSTQAGEIEGLPVFTREQADNTVVIGDTFYVYEYVGEDFWFHAIRPNQMQTWRMDPGGMRPLNQFQMRTAGTYIVFEAYVNYSRKVLFDTRNEEAYVLNLSTEATLLGFDGDQIIFQPVRQFTPEAVMDIPEQITVYTLRTD